MSPVTVVEEFEIVVGVVGAAEPASSKESIRSALKFSGYVN
jgi:hypothetical protein